MCSSLGVFQTFPTQFKMIRIRTVTLGLNETACKFLVRTFQAYSVDAVAKNDCSACVATPPLIMFSHCSIYPYVSLMAHLVRH
ncbi:hypothetical protein EG68_11752 [Paragonimus skrjabini miyazakii]|uniref:Uncharacterized protein n=1 Tax=Paragonimus skrjabini miyazakii TaxID=59628 RepID=A0A8S9YJS5_9TREM|nr:hypothetical protein EG68_11752 [Paragonimus skrjabini miyazakii]